MRHCRDTSIPSGEPGLCARFIWLPRADSQQSDQGLRRCRRTTTVMNRLSNFWCSVGALPCTKFLNLSSTNSPAAPAAKSCPLFSHCRRSHTDDISRCCRIWAASSTDNDGWVFLGSVGCHSAAELKQTCLRVRDKFFPNTHIQRSGYA